MDSFKVALGAFCLGMFVGWLIYTFVAMQRTMNLKVLTALIGFAGGTAAITAAFKIGGVLSSDFMYYFPGLMVTVLFLAALNYKERPRGPLPR
jgi:hypothetical protein